MPNTKEKFTIMIFVLLGAVFCFVLICFVLIVRKCFPQLQTLFQVGTKHSYSITIVWMLSSLIVIVSGAHLVHWFYVKYHIFERVQKTGSIVLPIAIDTVFVIIGVAFIIMITVLFGRWVGQSSGKGEGDNLHSEAPTGNPSANVWPPPPRR